MFGDDHQVNGPLESTPVEGASSHIESDAETQQPVRRDRVVELFGRRESPRAPHGARPGGSDGARPAGARAERRSAERAGCGRDGKEFEQILRMVDPVSDEVEQGGLSERQKRDNVVRLAFNGDWQRFERFCVEIADAIPPGTTVVLRGSAVTGYRWKDRAPFDADGPGTSDLDLTLVGGDVVKFFKVSGFFVPDVHSRPLSDEDADIAPVFVPLRERLMSMVQRPVNIQASREIVIQFRGDLLGQPYLTLLQKPEDRLVTPAPDHA
jgi:hypothetical protein